MAFVSDLTETIIDHLNITSFPTLMVLKYNFADEINEIYKYPGNELTTDNYEDIKAFLEPLALREQRNDVLYHKMKAPKNKGITITDRVD